MTGRPVRSGGSREPSNPAESGGGRETTTLWSAADRGDTEKVRELLTGSGSGSGEGGAVAGGGGKPVDVNARNCLGCTPLLYASGSGHVETVRIILVFECINLMMVHTRTIRDKVSEFSRGIMAFSSVEKLLLTSLW